jgi:hypothetical protein
MGRAVGYDLTSSLVEMSRRDVASPKHLGDAGGDAWFLQDVQEAQNTCIVVCVCCWRTHTTQLPKTSDVPERLLEAFVLLFKTLQEFHVVGGE